MNQKTNVKRLLLVDDDAPMRRFLGEVLQEWSFATTTAATLHEARTAVLTEEPFTVIVSGYDLPDGNGLEFLDWLNCEMRIHVPFLLMSGKSTFAPSAADGCEFLAKPFRLGEFRNRLEKLSRLNVQTTASSRWSDAQEAMASVYARSKPDKVG